ncbi:MAG TPA: glycosyltransferase family 2 protein [Bacillota bacterium]|nr:glycosyltransferase family 2 protein [Clostridiaceae bacterium]HNR03999.1 glycosyltransferase family 2 protein [Bacillota bacterium]HPA55477.1 glycosyltransferase family 2 protein [Bacillota bacterium]HPX68737.1 glycosyltransferase family 2 protein [Bacillota bacterium]HQA65135.1 glycosyltransferase family 2 protein [Bacillota bacterium]
MNVTAVIPAYNEEQTIADVVKCVKSIDKIQKVIVVSDGSTDSTAEIARECGADVIELDENVGKGGAIRAGINECGTEIILFLDADLIGLTEKHVLDLIEPVIDNKADMTIGIFKKGRMVTDLAQKVTPYLSGQRAIKKSIIDKIPNIDITRYGVEVALTKYVDKFNVRVQEVDLPDMTHVTKEEKLGIIRGVHARLKMYWDIVKILSSYNIKSGSSK